MGTFCSRSPFLFTFCELIMFLCDIIKWQKVNRNGEQKCKKKNLLGFYTTCSQSVHKHEEKRELSALINYLIIKKTGVVHNLFTFNILCISIESYYLLMNIKQLNYITHGETRDLQSGRLLFYLRVSSILR